MASVGPMQFHQLRNGIVVNVSDPHRNHDPLLHDESLVRRARQMYGELCQFIPFGCHARSRLSNHRMEACTRTNCTPTIIT